MTIRFKIVVALLEVTMQNKMFLVDAQYPSTHVHPYINESNTIADDRHTRYAEGDLILEIIKESMVARKIGIGSYLFP